MNIGFHIGSYQSSHLRSMSFGLTRNIDRSSCSFLEGAVWVLVCKFVVVQVLILGFLL